MNAKDVFKGEREMQEDYEFFSDLRNKNLVHDENTWSQCVTAAVLNKRDCETKIAWTFCFGVTGHTLSKENIPKMSRLAQGAVDWVGVRWEAEHARLAAELEQRPYDELDALGPIEYQPPGDRDGRTPKPRE